MDAPALPAEYLGHPILVGFSGGLDSHVMLHLLAAAPGIRAAGLRALHVHHGLHADANAWARHCGDVCDTLGIPMEVAEVVVDHSCGVGVEAAARAARHAAFAAAMRNGEVLALAHHRDDQAETLLLRALRGSGPDGLAAMRSWRRFGRGWLWRPLLDVGRDELAAYASLHALSWIDDPSNDDARFDRNFLRHRVMPLLRERWPQAGASLARSAALLAEAGDLLEAGDAPALAAARTIDPQALAVTALQRLEPARRARVLRRWISSLDLPALPAQGVIEIESMLADGRADTEAQFAWAGAVVRRWRDLLHAETHRDPLPPNWRVHWDGSALLQLPTADTLRFESHAASHEHEPARPVAAQADGFFVHTRQGGERIRLPGRSHTHALKQVLQDLGVPPWERTRLPLLSDHDGCLLAAGDLVYADRFDSWLRAQGMRLLWSRAGA